MSEMCVQPQELHNNASDVTAVAGQVMQAVGAGGAVTAMSPQAFGLLCSFFTPGVLTMSTAAIGAMTALDAALLANAAAVVATAEDFDLTDAAVADIHTSLQGKV